MKKIKVALLLVMVAVLTFGAIVFLELPAQRRAMDARGPLTLEELNKLAERRPPMQSDVSTLQPAPGSRSEDRHNSLEQGAPSDLSPTRPRLARVLTYDEKVQITERKNNNGTRFGPVLCTLIEVMTTAGLCAGLSEDGAGVHYSDAATIAYWTGDWKSATRLYRQALECPLDEPERRYIYVNMAWMEEHPKVATRLLELACPAEEDRPYVLSEAARLAHRTGSRELFDLYVSRLEEVSPEQAAQFR